MAWFRRKRDDEQPEETSAAAAEAASRAATGDIVRPDSARVGDWMALPPIATAVSAPPPTTFRVQRVAEIMTTRRPTALMGELGHRVSREAPAGAVHGLLTPTAAPVAPVASASSTTAASDLPLRVPARPDAPADEAPAPFRAVSDAAPLPVIQRQVAAVSAPAPPAPLRATSPLPPPAPTRVLREPAAPARPSDRPAPPLAVVGESMTTAAAPPAAPVLAVAPDAPAEAQAPLATSATPDAPLAPASEPASTQQNAAPLLDLPLASPLVSGDVTPRAAKPADLMPPIQPRAIQRKIDDGAAQAGAAPRGDGDGLPPFPSWAKVDAPAPAAAPSMPLQRPVVQREADPAATADEVTDAGGSPTAATDAPADAPGDVEATAPLLGDAPLAASVAPAESEGDDEESAGAAPDLPLHAVAAAQPAASVQTERIDSTPVAAAAGTHTHDDGSVHEDGDDDAHEAQVAPLLGDRSLQLQRSIDATAAPATPAAPGNARTDLPLVVDAPGPALGNAPRASAAAPAPGGSTSSGMTSVLAAASARPVTLQRDASSIAAIPAAATTPSSMGAPAAPAPVARPLAARTLPAVGGDPARAVSLPVQTLADGGTSPGAAAAAAAATTSTAASTRVDLPLQAPSRGNDGPAAFATDTSRAFDSAIAAGLAHRDADGAVVFTQQAAPAIGLDGLPIQREALPGANGSTTNPASTPTSAPGATTVVQRAIGSSGPAAPAAEAGESDDAQLDKLAKDLYPRIRWKLQAELRNDRSRFSDGSWTRYGR